jgi:hypothetical protein
LKIISSPVKAFPGEIVLPDYLTLPQCLAFEAANRDCAELREKSAKLPSRTELDAINLPMIWGIVQEWRIQRITTLEAFPFTPRIESAELIAWLMNEIAGMYIGEVEIPND